MLKLAALALFLSACGSTGAVDSDGGGTSDAPPPPNGTYAETWTQTSAARCYTPSGWTAVIKNGDWCSAITPFTTTDDSCATSCEPAGDHAVTATIVCGRCTATYAVTFTAQ